MPSTPVENHKRLMCITFDLGLVGLDGKDMAFDVVESVTINSFVIHVRKYKHTAIFEGVTEMPVLPLNRDFSIPITLTVEQQPEDLTFRA